MWNGLVVAMAEQAKRTKRELDAGRQSPPMKRAPSSPPPAAAQPAAAAEPGATPAAVAAAFAWATGGGAGTADERSAKWLAVQGATKMQAAHRGNLARSEGRHQVKTAAAISRFDQAFEQAFEKEQAKEGAVSSIQATQTQTLALALALALTLTLT